MGGYASRAACIRCTAGAWEPPVILPVTELTLPAQNAGTVYGLSCSQIVRISIGMQSDAALFCPQQTITSLCLEADSLLLPYPDGELIFETLCRLVDSERELLYDCKRINARITISSSGTALLPYPAADAAVSITLLPYDEPSPGIRGVCRCASGNLGVLREAVRREGYDEVFLLDNIYKRYIIGTNIHNVFFRIGDNVVTPMGEGVKTSVMAECVKELMRGWGITVAERQISEDELQSVYGGGALREAFVADAAFGIQYVRSIDTNGTRIELEQGKLERKLAGTLENIESGACPAPHNWVRRI